MIHPAQNALQTVTFCGSIAVSIMSLHFDQSSICISVNFTLELEMGIGTAEYFASFTITFIIHD